jgi:mono/diheme cytochrome c family protein
MTRATFVLLALAGAGCHDGRVDLERMIDQRKLEAYEATTVFEDGKVMRTPPPDTVPRGSSASRDRAAGLGGKGEVVAPLLPLTSALLKRGQDRFNTFCATCHGLLGDGQSQVAENMRLRPPPSLHDARLRALPTGSLYAVIRDGYGLMPAYGSALSVDDRWAVVTYVGALQLSQNVELSRLPTNLQQEAQPWLK